MPDQKEIQPPRDSPSDSIRDLIEAIIGLLPRSSLLNYAANKLIPSARALRVQSFYHETAAMLNQLDRSQRNRVEELRGNEAFQSLLLQSYLTVVQTHQEEKLEAVRNVLLNSAAGTNLAFDIQSMFLNMLHQYTPTHLKLLSIMDNPRKYFEDLGIDVATITQTEKFGRTHLMIVALLPDYGEEGDIYLKMCSDLHASELIPRNQIDMERFEALEGQLTNLGKRFMRFVLTPPQTD